MTTAVLEKRVARLESEVRSLRSVIPAILKPKTALPVGKRLLAAVKAGERDIMAGRILRGDLRDLMK